MTNAHNSKPPSTGHIAHFPTPSSSFQFACRIWFMPSDEKIASELRRLSLHEREKVWADLSGNEKTSSFRKEVVEDDVIIRAALEDLRREIDDIHINESLVLNRQQSHYVNDRSFQLMFLRSCDYDGKAAAKLLIDHIDMKRQLFGEDTLGRDITRDDMREHELEMISSGGLGFLQDRDSAGRAVLLSNFSRFRVKERENLPRVFFYLLMLALKDESVQKLGVVSVFNMLAQIYCGRHDYEADRLAYQTIGAIPVRVVARYYVYESDTWDHVVDVMTYLASPCIRVRTRNIKGTWQYALYALISLGVPVECIPTDHSAQELLNEKTIQHRTHDHDIGISNDPCQKLRKRLLHIAPSGADNGNSPATVIKKRRRTSRQK